MDSDQYGAILERNIERDNRHKMFSYGDRLFYGRSQGEGQTPPPTSTITENNTYLLWKSSDALQTISIVEGCEFLGVKKEYFVYIPPY